MSVSVCLWLFLSLSLSVPPSASLCLPPSLPPSPPPPLSLALCECMRVRVYYTSTGGSRYVVDGEGVGFGSLEARVAALARGSALGDWLRTLPPLRVLADNVFIHAGRRRILSPLIAPYKSSQSFSLPTLQECTIVSITAARRRNFTQNSVGS